MSSGELFDGEVAVIKALGDLLQGEAVEGRYVGCHLARYTIREAGRVGRELEWMGMLLLAGCHIA